MDKTKIDLNAPAFGKGAQSLEDLKASVTAEDTQASDSQPKEEVKEKEGEEQTDASVEEQKVPYSRFKKYHDEARQARQEAEEWRAKAESLQSQPRRETAVAEAEMPEYWVDLYGDSEASAKAWKVQERANQQMREDAKREALEAVRNERSQESERIESNMDTIESNLEALTEFVGRKLTDKEESAVLDIVDNYTAKDADGNYMGAVMPFEKAWEIYELKQNSGSAKQRQARDSVASLTATSTQGDTAADAGEKEKNWNPLDWNAWRKRV